MGEEENIEEQVEEQSNNTEEKDQNSASADNLRVLENIDVKLTVEVGSAELKIKELLRLNEGSVIELDRLAGDPLDILINGTMIAKGEVVMEIPLNVSCRLSEPTVSMNKLLQTRTGDTFPIYVGEGIEVLIEDQLVFLSELGELSGQAAVNLKKRLSK